MLFYCENHVKQRKDTVEKMQTSLLLEEVVYADDVNLLGDNIDAIKKNMEILIDASKEVGLEVNTEKTKYMLLSRHQIAERS
jgi:hypothetical protein